MDRNSPVTELKGVGEKTGKLFGKLDIRTVGDLLDAYPRDYEAFREPVPISGAAAGEVCAVQGTVSCIPGERTVRNLSVLSVDIADSSGRLGLVFYNMPFLKKTLRKGGCYIFRGLVQAKGKGLSMEQPKIFSAEEYGKLTGRLVPRYALTKGLTSRAIEKCVSQALAACRFPEECYEERFLAENGLIPCREAVEAIHFPADREAVARARRRLAFDEFFSFLYCMRRNKSLSERLPNAHPMPLAADTERFLEDLPFPLTGAQRRVWQEIQGDLAGSFCMNRLIQGDVGSGKTILAILALLRAAENGYQGALMAPTEVLARQHFENIQGYVMQYGLAFRPVLLVGSMTARERREAYGRIASGEANLAIGTHALIQEKVQYHSLALVVTDEQHRFGVRQREHLAGKGDAPHILVMSATPIPRTLAIILYGDLHISVVDELPAGRLPIKNCVVGANYRPTAYRFIAGQVAQGRQVYVVCPQVEGDDDLEGCIPMEGGHSIEGDHSMEGGHSMENVVDYAEKLKGALPAGIRVACLHGRMRPADKSRIMEQFAARQIDVLVSTTVIEVGINVPNATVMMVEDAERFGLAQLHQLRGRVGRGEHQSYCIFVSANGKPEALERLQVLNESNDGFFIASEDLRLRGPGELLGIRQSGAFSFRIGDIYSDAAVLKQASWAVDRLLTEDPELERPEHIRLKEQLEEAASRSVDFRSI